MSFPEANFHVLLENKIWPIKIDSIETVWGIVRTIVAENPQELAHLKEYGGSKYTFRMLKTPVRGDLSKEDIILACSEQSNLDWVYDQIPLLLLRQTWDKDFVYFVIRLTKNIHSPHSSLDSESSFSSAETSDSGWDDDRNSNDLHDDEHEHNDSILKSEEVNSLLVKLGYRLFGRIKNPNVDLVVGANKDLDAYIKFVKKGHKEVEILQYLSRIKSPTNHTIVPIGVWPIEQGSIVVMPIGGKHLTELKNPSLHLWSTARQLFEGVEFLHSNKIAHLDLKPENIVIPPEYGTLTIIDFNAAVRLDKGDRFKGMVGTPGYIAPEVGDTSYSAVQADLWSCGVIVEELCMISNPSPARTRLLEISALLMDRDPKKRPMMEEVLEMILSGDNYDASAICWIDNAPSKDIEH